MLECIFFFSQYSFLRSIVWAWSQGTGFKRVSKGMDFQDFLEGGTWGVKSDKTGNAFLKDNRVGFGHTEVPFGWIV